MRILFALWLSLILSCSDQETINGSSVADQLTGRWLEISDFGNTIYEKTSRYGDFEKGLVFFEDGSLIGRSESSICIGENCLMENYKGSWTLETDDKIIIEVESLKGNQRYSAQIISISSDSLVLRRKK